MKTIGHLNDGHLIVEMTESEHNEYLAAVKAAQGLTWSEAAMTDSHYPPPIDVDMKGFFWALRKFIVLKFAANELRAQIERLEGVLEIGKPKEHH